MSRCDLCSRGSEPGLGPVLVIDTPEPPAFERRQKPRRQHRQCADALAAHRAAEKQRTKRWLDEQYVEFAARRLVAS